MRLKGKTALVTGGARGIGKAVAERFLREGAKVAIADMDAYAIDEAAAELSAAGETIGIAGDVGRAADASRLVEQTVARWGTIDIVVNNAGICSPSPFLELTEDDWDRHMSVNLKGTFLVGQRAAREMVDRGVAGAIVNMSSVNGLAAEADQAHYNASKGGINLLTMSMALELAPRGIRVNALCPGFVETRLTRPLIDDPAAIAPYLRTIPMGRVGTPDDIAAAALFLASDDSRYMTGHCMVVDGGQFIKLS